MNFIFQVLEDPSLRFTYLPRLECFGGKNNEKSSVHSDNFWLRDDVIIFALSSPRNFGVRQKVRRDVWKQMEEIKTGWWCVMVMVGSSLVKWDDEQRLFQNGRFWHERTPVRMQPSSIFYKEHIFTVKRWKRVGNADEEFSIMYIKDTTR